MTTIAGYTFVTTLAPEWATADVQLKHMDTYGRLANWSAVQQAFTTTIEPVGKSLKELIETSPAHAFQHEDMLPLLQSYYGYDDSVAFVERATWGTDFAAGWDDTSRREMLTKGSAYRNVLYHVWQRLSQGLAGCVENDAAGSGAAPGVYEWETAWALFAGSLEGVDGSVNKGYSVYALGDKRCPQFSTCVGGTTSGLAAPNEAARAALETGIGAFQSAQQLRASGADEEARRACHGAVSSARAFRAASIVPLVQGTLREAYEIDPAASGNLDGLVEVAEGWAFVTPILPLVSACDGGVARLIYGNMYLNGAARMADGFGAVKAALESVYPCLGISCASVGGMLEDGAPIVGFEPCDAPHARSRRSSVEAGVRI